MEDRGPLCPGCADLGHLVFLPAGDAALTGRARKASGLSAVVVRFGRSRGRCERQGILVKEEARREAGLAASLSMEERVTLGQQLSQQVASVKAGHAPERGSWSARQRGGRIGCDGGGTNSNRQLDARGGD